MLADDIIFLGAPKPQYHHWFRYFINMCITIKDIQKMKLKHNWPQEVPNIRNMGIQGHTLNEIGAHYGVTGMYINKLIKKYNIFDDGTVYGASAKAQSKQEIKQKQNYLKYGNKNDTKLYRAQRDKFIIKQSNMKRAGIEFTINFGELIWPEYCPILGIKLDYFVKGGVPQDNSPSFDRIDNTKGYVKDNVFIISNKANRLKNNGNIQELRKIIEYLENNIPSKAIYSSK
jgi:hypothetical protein